jgi:hypothetical protein
MDDLHKCINEIREKICVLIVPPTSLAFLEGEPFFYEYMEPLHLGEVLSHLECWKHFEFL